MAGRGIMDLVEYGTGTSRYGARAGWSENGWFYPVDLEFTLRQAGRYYEPRDAAGLPMRNYGDAEARYSPSRVNAWALAHWNRLQNGVAESRPAFLQAADWLRASTNGRFTYEFDWGRNRAPWISCLAQGEGASVLLRAAMLSGDKGYLEMALRAIEPLLESVEQGGVQGAIDGKPFLEEYPAGDHPHVLNGCLYAMVGLLDVARHDPDHSAHGLLKDVAATLEQNIDRWDLGGWSSYDLSHEGNGGFANACTPAYQSLHSTLLGFVARACSLARCEEVADRWSSGCRHPLTRLRALKMKIRYRRRFPAQT